LGKIDIFNLTRQIDALREGIQEALWTTLSSGQFILGRQVQSFETEFCAYLGCRHAIGVGSGTGSLTLAYQRLRGAYHRCVLQEQPGRIAQDELREERGEVERLWRKWMLEEVPG